MQYAYWIQRSKLLPDFILQTSYLVAVVEGIVLALLSTQQHKALTLQCQQSCRVVTLSPDERRQMYLEVKSFHQAEVV